MKRYNKILLLLILLIPLTLCSCKKKDTIMENYPSITDKKHVIVELSPKELIEKISNQESFIVTLGFEACPWCQALMPEYNEVAKSEGLKEVYYVDIKDMRDNVESSDRIYYLALYSYFNEIVDIEKDRINAPTMLAIKNGKLEAFHIDTVSTHTINEQGILPALTAEQKTLLHSIIKGLISKVK